MPKIERRPIAQKTVTITSPSKKPPKWRDLISELESLSPDSVLALTPDEGDSPRALKVQVSRAAKAAGRQADILYGQNAHGELEVWLRDKPKQTRGPRKKRSESGQS